MNLNWRQVMSERGRVRGKIAKYLFHEMESLRPTYARDWADYTTERILALPEIAVLADDKSLPCNCSAPSIVNLNTYPEGVRFGYYQAIQDMLRAGFRRVV